MVMIIFLYQTLILKSSCSNANAENFGSQKPCRQIFLMPLGYAQISNIPLDIAKVLPPGGDVNASTRTLPVPIR